MRVVVVVLACWACDGYWHGRAVKRKQTQRSRKGDAKQIYFLAESKQSQLTEQVGVVHRLKALARVLLALENPSAGWQTSANMHTLDAEPSRDYARMHSIFGAPQSVQLPMHGAKLSMRMNETLRNGLESSLQVSKSSLHSSFVDLSLEWRARDSFAWLRAREASRILSTTFPDANLQIIKLDDEPDNQHPDFVIRLNGWLLSTSWGTTMYLPMKKIREAVQRARERAVQVPSRPRR
mmetsp:Transcript_10897/g.18126  ORF Transcript_10897/g.18126 Transcript_10897/m.18126 type:complete len:237 (+) Transcript_10897:39-749(+)